MRLPAVIAVFFLTSSLALRAEVFLLDIDRAGPAVVDQLKSSPAVAAWSELGETLVVEAGKGFASDTSLQSRVLKRLPVDQLGQLASRALVHCNGDEEGHAKHTASEVLFARSHWQLVATQGKSATDEILRPGRVVAWQQGNRKAKLLAVDPTVQEFVDAVDIGNWRTRVNALATFDRQTEAGFEGAATQVASVFTALGLDVSRQEFTPPIINGTRGRTFNVLGRQAGRGQGTLIVGAHLDSRNRTWDESLPSPGAEDNGSGCAAVMETARILRGVRFAADIVYVCYGLEERGLHGGRAHAQAQTPSEILGVINMDMIAFEGDGRLDVSLQATAPGFGLQQRLADNAARYTSLEVEIAQQTCCSDHQPYLDLGMPAVLLIENDYQIYPQYHTVDDTADRLSNAMAHEVLKMAVATAVEVAKLEEGQRYSGYWYNPAQSGHGFHIEYQDNGLVFMTWYTFDAAGNRLWIIATGPMSGNQATLPAHEATGGAFPPAFVRENVHVLPWGSFNIEFHDCSHATFRWTPLPSTGLPAGSLEVIRSSEPRGAGCT
jgi:hypothetical protein